MTVTTIKPSTLIQERIQAAMEYQNVSQAELAKRMGISAPRVSQLLDSEANLTVRTIERLSEALDTDLIR
jgi:transcriptional regulator with XRE-family HTH domain